MASALRRGKEIHGITRCRKQDYKITKIKPQKRKGGTWVLILPSKITDERIAEKTLQENTLYPLYAALGRWVGQSVYTPIAGWKICIACVSEDITQFGTAYIHLAHLPESVRICYKHAIELDEYCPTCNTSITSHRLYALTECAESFPTTEGTPGILHHSYAIFVHELLNFRGSTFSQTVVSRDLFEQYAKVTYGGDCAKTASCYRNDMSSFLNSSFSNNDNEHYSFNFSLALAFHAFSDADSFSKFTGRNDAKTDKPLIRLAHRNPPKHPT